MTNEEAAQYFYQPDHLQAWLCGRLPPPITWIHEAMEPQAEAIKPMHGVPRDHTAARDALVLSKLTTNPKAIITIARQAGLEKTKARRSLLRLVLAGQATTTRMRVGNLIEPQLFYRKAEA